MSRLPWHTSWDPFRGIEQEVGRLLGQFEPLRVRAPRPFPASNLYDAGDQYVLTAELPGVSPKEIDLAITGETLTLRGERRRSEEIADDRYRRQERQFGRWARTVSLPDRVDNTQVSAQFSQGVLTITLPKAEEAKPRQIVVSTTD